MPLARRRLLRVAPEAAGDLRLLHARQAADEAQQRRGLGLGVRLQVAAFAGAPGLQGLVELLQQARAEATQARQATAAQGLLQGGQGVDAQFLVQLVNPLRADGGQLQQLDLAGWDFAMQEFE